MKCVNICWAYDIFFAKHRCGVNTWCLCYHPVPVFTLGTYVCAVYLRLDAMSVYRPPPPPDRTQTAIIENLRRDIQRRYRFLLAEHNIQVISGREEGIYQWIAINFALGRWVIHSWAAYDIFSRCALKHQYHHLRPPLHYLVSAVPQKGLPLPGIWFFCRLLL